MRMVCFGDSNTYGYDPRGYWGGRYAAENRWVDLLAAQTGWEIVNAGENGREIPNGSSALRIHDEYAPADIFLVMLGTNDLLQGLSATDTASRMEQFLTALLPHFPKLLLVTPPPMQRGAWVERDSLVRESLQLSEEYGLLSRKLGIPFVDSKDWNVPLAFDGVHFTEAGHHTFTKMLRKELRL